MPSDASGGSTAIKQPEPIFCASAVLAAAGKRMLLGDVSPEYIGVIGVVIFGTLTLGAALGTYREVWRCPKRQRNHMRAAFFALAIVYPLLQLPMNIRLIRSGNMNSCAMYSFHVAGSSVLVACFFCVIVMWVEVLERSERALIRVRIACAALVVLLLGETCFVVPRCWQYVATSSFNSFVVSPEMRILILTAACELVGCSVAMVVAGGRILHHMRHFSATYTGKRARILRLLVAMTLCSGAFMVRGVILVLLETSRALVQESVSFFSWTLINDWLPTALPLLTMMLIMRRAAARARAESSVDGSALIETPDAHLDRTLRASSTEAQLFGHMDVDDGEGTDEDV